MPFPKPTIFDALNAVSNELNDFFNAIRTNDGNDAVVLGNIAFADPYQSGGGVSDSIKDKVVLTLVNVEEEKTLRNMPASIPVGSGYSYQNPPIVLNLYVLFSVNYHSTLNSYDNSLIYLSEIIAFFQRKKTFTALNTPLLMDKNVDKLIFDLHSLSFEQMNHLWAVLGGKYIPSVLYKVRLLEIQNTPESPVPLIEQVENDAKVFLSTPT
jgi:Pvc16 N-terminal domain